MKSTTLKNQSPIPGSNAIDHVANIGSDAAAKVEAQTLRAPDSTRAPLGEQQNLQATQRRSGQLQVRAGSSTRAHQGTRSKKLKEERIDQLGRLEAVSFGPLAQRLEGVVADLREKVGALEGREAADVHTAVDAALEPHRAPFSTAIQQAIRGPRSALTKRGIDAMRASGADTLMFHVLLSGKLSMRMVHAEMGRLTRGLRGGDLSVTDIKKGLVTADGLLQRFRLAGVSVEHGYAGNGPRDLLLSFASSLHR